MGKLIVVEGTDCSGKETQTNMLMERLKRDGYSVCKFSFPMYDTPTGKIIGACLLGKPHMCEELLQENHSFFPEGGGNIDPLVAIALYAADRRYNLPRIMEALDNNDVLILDRYVPSNMAHRGGLAKNKLERKYIYESIEKEEYDINEMPRPDKTILLYMPYEQACILKQNRKEKPDETETNEEYLRRGEEAYLELAEMYKYDVINCTDNERIRTIEEINEDVYQSVLSMLKKNDFKRKLDFRK
ncbi:MAG: hypothetical protein E7158_03725 [Firmicutes bacterium]|nr:hypothetical protein [Bacillota bacterium]